MASSIQSESQTTQRAPASDGSSTRFSPASAEHYRESGAWRGKTLAEEFAQIVERYPDNIALMSATESIRYRELDELTDRFGAGLLARGLQRGDRALLQLGNGLETVIVLIGAQKVGVVPVATLPNHGTYELTGIGNFIGAKAIIVQGRYRRYDLPEQALGLRDSIPTLETVIAVGGEPREGVVAYDDILAAVPAVQAREVVRALQAEIDPESDFMIQLTGGTTGLPKIIPHSASSYLGLIAAYNEHVGLRSDDRWIYCTPVVHNAGTVTAMYPVLLAGATLVLAEGIAEEHVRAVFRATRPTIATAQRPVARLFTEHARSLPDEEWSSLRLIVFCWNDREIAAALERSTEAEIVGLFGMSEGPLLCGAPGSSEVARTHTSGRFIDPHVHTRIVDLVTGEELGLGTAGELQFKGASVIEGYHGIDNTPYFTDDGYLRTGDLARAVEEGGIRHYVIEGRIRDNISRGGEKYMAAEIERLLLKHDSVAEVSIVPKPDVAYGERAVAFVVPEEGATFGLRECVAYMAALGVAKYKWPEYVETLSALPRPALADVKVDKNALRVLAEALDPIVPA